MKKTVLITGAARRIGAEIARYLHSADMNIILHYRHSTADAKALQKELVDKRPDSCTLLQGDLQDIEAFPALIHQAARQWGGLNALINNASSYYPTPIDTLDESQWNDLILSNLKAPFFLAQAAATLLEKNQGCIVNIVDIHGIRPLKDYSIYSIAKAGLISATRSLAKELGPDIRVNGIAPGAILWPETKTTDQQKAEIISRVPLGRIGLPTDIAKAALFLIRDADYITGQIIGVDGGRSLSN